MPIILLRKYERVVKSQAEKLNFDIKAIIGAAQKKQKKSAYTLVPLRSREARLTSRSS